MNIEVLSPLETRRLKDGKRKLTADLVLLVNKVRYVVPEGFVTDFSSYPWMFRWIVRWSKVDVAGVFHDWLYRTGILTRKESDRLWREVAMAGQHSANKPQAYLSWLGLRVGAASTWAKYRDEDGRKYY